MGKIRATLDTTKLRGTVGRNLTVKTNDPLRSTLTLTLRVEVLGSVLILPTERLRLTNARGGARTGRLLIRQDPTERGELSINGLQTSVPWLSARVEERMEGSRALGGALPPGEPGDWLLEVRLEGAAQQGFSKQSVRFRTGLSRQPEVAVPVMVSVRPPVNLTAEELTLATPAPGGESSSTVHAVVRQGLDPAALEVEAEPPTFQVRVEPNGPRRFLVEVSWRAVGKSPPDEGTIIFRIGDETTHLPVRVGSGLTF